MATVAETELEQKTSEYFEFVKIFFETSNKNHYSNNRGMTVCFKNNEVLLEYKRSKV